MRNVIIAFAAAALLASAGPAFAGHKKHHGHHNGGHHKVHHVQKHHKHKHHGHKHHRKHRRHGWGSFFFGFPIVHYNRRPDPVYVQPVPQQRARYNCQPTTGTRYINGRLANIGGTFCYDALGQGYIVPGSEYFISYVQ